MRKCVGVVVGFVFALPIFADENISFNPPRDSLFVYSLEHEVKMTDVSDTAFGRVKFSQTWECRFIESTDLQHVAVFSLRTYGNRNGASARKKNPLLDALMGRNPIGPYLAGMVGQKFQVVFNNRGEAIDVPEWKSLLRSVQAHCISDRLNNAAPAPPLYTEEDLANLRANAPSFLTEERLLDLANTLVFAHSENAFTVGDSWSFGIHSDLRTNEDTHIGYRLSRVSREELSAEVTQPFFEELRGFEAAGTVEGTAIVDSTTGLLKSKVLSGTVQGSIPRGPGSTRDIFPADASVSVQLIEVS